MTMPISGRQQSSRRTPARHLLACVLLAMPLLATAQNPYKPAPWVGDTLWGTACRGGQGYGPFDYLLRSNNPKDLRLVEGAHFTPNVEHLIKGESTTDPLGDLDYTLRAWPNHHRALNTAIRARLQKGRNWQRSQYPPAECYLQRAIAYSPKDGTAEMLYAMLLHQSDLPERAFDHYTRAEKLLPTDVQVKYNFGLLLVEMGRYDEARERARYAYGHDFPLPGLKNKLQQAGQWE